MTTLTENNFDESKYYNVFDDIEAYPDCVIFEAHSQRGPGKTYGFLWGCMSRGIKFVYMKRTQIDIDIIKLDEFNPLKPINRDRGKDYYFDDASVGKGKRKQKIDGVSLIKEDETLMGYAVAMSAIHKFKGFDLSECEYICFDEYIPQLSERLNHSEGSLLLDFVKTVNRDRNKRGKPYVKLVLFANTTNIFCPVTDELNIVDDIAEMEFNGEEYRHIADRHILLHSVPFDPEEVENDPWYQATKDTRWADMAFKGKFSYNDFSRVKKVPLKNMVCFCEVKYKKTSFYIYRNNENGLYYMCKSRGGKKVEVYDLEIEADQRRFWLIYGILLKNEITDGNMFFSSYSAYNLLFNFTKIYKF